MIRHDYLIIGVFVVILAFAAGIFRIPGELGSGQSINVPAASTMEVSFFNADMTSEYSAFTCINNNPGAQMDDRVTFGSTNCCTNPSQPCYPTCTMTVTDTTNLCRGTITYAGNEGLEYAYYKINGCWVSSVGPANPAVTISNCQLVLPQSEEPSQTQPSGGTPEQPSGQTGGTQTKTVFDLFIELIQNIIARIMGIFG